MPLLYHSMRVCREDSPKYFGAGFLSPLGIRTYGRAGGGQKKFCFFRTTPTTPHTTINNQQIPPKNKQNKSMGRFGPNRPIRPKIVLVDKNDLFHHQNNFQDHIIHICL